MQQYEHGGDIYGKHKIALDFSVNIHPLGMPQAVKQAIVDGLPGYETYPDPDCRALRAALGNALDLSSEQILCGNGASELIFALCAATGPKTALTLAPTFSEYGRAVRLHGGEVREFALRETADFALDESILSQLTPDLDIVFLCSPNNPTGRLIDPSLLHKIASACHQNDTLVLLDECFLDFTRGESMLAHLATYPNLLILRAFTKIYAMAGLRLGFLCGAHVALLAQIKAHCPTWSVSAVAQTAGVAALQVGNWIPETLKIVEEERAYLQGALTELGCKVYQSDANFLLVKSGRPIYEPLRARGILVRNCGNFSGLDERYFRIGVKTHDKNEQLIEALKEVLHG